MKFINTGILDRVDWYKEIANEPELEQKEQINRASEAVMIWTMVEEQFSSMNMKTDNEKANALRILQYFLGKFIYHHAIFYKRYEDTKDVTESINSLRRTNEFFFKLHDASLPPSVLPIDKIIDMGKMFQDIERKRKEKEKKLDGGYEEVAKYIKSFGEEPVDNSCVDECGDRDSVCFMYDGVRYMIYIMKEKNKRQRKKDARESYDGYLEMRNRYHPIIKKVYTSMLEQLPELGDIYVMSGGGMQIQAFFGNKDSYIGILYFGMRGEKDDDEKYEMILQGYNRDEQFKDVNIPDIKITTCFSIYGDSLR